jgi:hypothetical protein
VTWRLTAGVNVHAGQRLGKQVPATKNKQTTLEILLSYNDGKYFSAGSALKLYNEDPRSAET